MSPLRVVIVEDEALSAMSLQGFLEDAGHQVLGWATTAEEASRLIAEVNPDLVFVDLHLADGLTGLKVGEELRNARRPFVFVTANSRMLPPDYVGALGVIGKPYATHGIQRALEYIEQALRSPPPRCARPSSFLLAPHYEARWH
jgi:CheY-like chemotaxis protein